MSQGSRSGLFGAPPAFAADFSICYTQEKPEEEYAPKFAARAYKPGDRVKVWSNGKQEFLRGEVQAVVQNDGIFEGYSVSAGTVKVMSEAGVKWILPENVLVHLKKDEAFAIEVCSPAVSREVTGDEVRMCKNGCGKRIQPGLCRSLRAYDTCCKACAQHRGQGKHDPNCGGDPPQGSRERLEAGPAPDLDAHVFYKRRLERLLQDPAVVAQYATHLFNEQVSSGGGGDTISRSQAAEGVRALLYKLFMFKQVITEDFMDYLNSLQKLEATLNREEFISLCNVVLLERSKLWFPEVLTVTTRNFVKKNERSLGDVYQLGKKLGRGTFGDVYEVTHIVSGEQRVCKRILKTNKAADYKQIMQEIGNMAMLDHPNVIKVYEYFEDENCVCQIMEQCKGGELQDQMDLFRKKGKWPYTEAFICDVMKQTLRALAFMHKKPIMHKDLKPQNIMMVSKDSSSIKVIDFGLAELFRPAQEISTTPGGTLLYMAPEVFRHNMTVKIDIWSVGVILYNLLTGEFPFMEPWPFPEGKDERWWQERTVDKIKHSEPTRNVRLGQASNECLDLLWKMLTKDFEKRPDASQCLAHPWFQKFCEVPPPLSVGVVQCIEAYARMSELKKAVFLLIAHQSELKAAEELRALFTHFDFSNQGSLSAADLHHVLVQSGMACLRAERVVHGLDRDTDGAITWTEFIAAAMTGNVSRGSKNSGVDAAFATIDIDKDGRISSEDITRVLAGTDGPSSQAWRRKCPMLLEDMLQADAATPRKAVTKIRDMTTKLLGSEQAATNEQFQRYICQEIVFRPGTDFHAVY